MSVIRVVHILSSIEYSGAEMLLERLEPYLHKRGIETILVSTGKRIGPFAESFQRMGVRVLHIPIIPFHRFVPEYLALLWRLKPDVVVIHIEKAFFWIALLTRIKIKKIIRIYHFAWMYDGYLRIKRTWMRKIMTSFGVCNIAVSQDVMRNEKMRFGINCAYLPNGVDVDHFSPLPYQDRMRLRQAFGIKEDVFLILSVGKCELYKSHLTILKAIGRLRGEFEFIYYHLGTGSLEEKERAFVSDNNLKECVRFVGNTNEVKKYLAIADCFVMPSEVEGLGIACAEAMAMQLPVVVSDAPGLRCLLESGANGLIVKTGDYTALAEAIKFLYQNPNKSQEFGANARRRIVDEFGFAKYEQMMFDLLTGRLGGKKL